MGEDSIKLTLELEPKMSEAKQQKVLNQVEQIRTSYDKTVADLMFSEGASDERLGALGYMGKPMEGAASQAADEITNAIRNLGHVFSGITNNVSSQLTGIFDAPVKMLKSQMSYVAKMYNTTAQWTDKAINNVVAAQASAIETSKRINEMTSFMLHTGANGQITRKNIGSADETFFSKFDTLRTAYLTGIEELQHKGTLPPSAGVIASRMADTSASKIYRSVLDKTLGALPEEEIKAYTRFMTAAVLPQHYTKNAEIKNAPFIKKYDSVSPIGHLPEAYQDIYMQAYRATQDKSYTMPHVNATPEQRGRIKENRKAFEAIQKLAEEDKTGVINDLALESGLIFKKTGHRLNWRSGGSEAQIRHFAASLPIELERIKRGNLQWQEDSLDTERWNRRSVVLDKAIATMAEHGVEPQLFENVKYASSAPEKGGKETTMRAFGFPRTYIIPKTSFDENGNLIYRNPTPEEIRVPKGQKAGVERKDQKFVGANDSAMMRMLRQTATELGYEVDDELGYYTKQGKKIPLMTKVPLTEVWDSAREANGWFPEGGYEKINDKAKKSVDKIAGRINKGTKYDNEAMSFGFLNEDDMFFIPTELEEAYEKKRKAAGVTSAFNAGNVEIGGKSGLLSLPSREAFVKQTNNVKSFNTPSHGEEEYYPTRGASPDGVNTQYINWTALSKLYELYTGESMGKESILDSLAFITPEKANGKKSIFDEGFQGRAAGPILKFAAVLGNLPKTIKESGLISTTTKFGQANTEFNAPSVALNEENKEELIDLYRYYYGGQKPKGNLEGWSKEEIAKINTPMTKAEEQNFQQRWLINAADEDVDIYFADTSVKDAYKSRYLTTEDYRTQMINRLKKLGTNDAEEQADKAIARRQAEMRLGADKEWADKGLIRLNADEYKRNMDTSIDVHGGIASVREAGAFETNKNFMPASMAQSLNLPYSAYAQSIENYQKMFAQWQDPAWIQRHGFEAMPAYQREMERNPAFMETDTAKQYIQSQIKDIREHMEKGELALSTPGYSAIAGMTTGMALNFLEKLTGNEVDPNSTFGPLFKSSLTKMYSDMAAKETNKEKKAEYEEILSEIEQDKYFIAPGLEGKDSSKFHKLIAERYPAALGTAVAGRNLYYNPDGTVNTKIAEALKASGAKDDVFYLPSQAMYKMNTGDYDGDTVWAYVAQADSWIENINNVDKRLTVLREQMAKTKAAQEEAMPKETKEIISNLDKGQETLRASFLNTYSKGAMGLGSAVIRNALQMPEGAAKDAALLEGIQYYDLATSEIKKKGLTNIKLGKHGFDALLVGSNFDRLMRDIYNYENADEEAKKDMHLPSIFKSNIGSINDSAALGTIAMNQSTARAAGGSFALRKKMADYVRESYGSTSQLAQAAEWYSKIRIGDLTGEHFVTDDDIAEGYKWLDLIKQEKLTKGTAGQELYDNEIKYLEKALKFMSSDMSTSQKNIREGIRTNSNLDRSQILSRILQGQGLVPSNEIYDVLGEEKQKAIEEQQAVEAMRKDERFRQIEQSFVYNPNLPNGGEKADGTKWAAFPRRYSVTATEAWFDKTALPLAGDQILSAREINLEPGVKYDKNGYAVPKDRPTSLQYNSDSSFGNLERRIQQQADEIMGENGNVDIMLGNYMHKSFENFWERQIGYVSDAEKRALKTGETDKNLTTGYGEKEIENLADSMQKEFSSFLSGEKKLDKKTMKESFAEYGFDLYRDDRTKEYRVKPIPGFADSSQDQEFKDKADTINDKLRSMQGYYIGGSKELARSGSLGNLIRYLYGEANKTVGKDMPGAGMLRVVGKEGEIYDRQGNRIWNEDDNQTHYKLPNTDKEFTTHAKPDAVVEIGGKYYIVDYKSSKAGAKDSITQSMLYQKQYEERAKNALISGDIDSDEYKAFAQFGELVDEETKNEKGETVKQQVFKSKFGGLLGFDARGNAVIKYSNAHADWNGKDYIDVIKDEYLKAVERKQEDLEKNHYAAGQLKLIRDRADDEVVKYAIENGMLPSDLTEAGRKVETAREEYAARRKSNGYTEMSSAETDFYIARYAQDKNKLDEIETALRSEQSRLRKKNNPYGFGYDRFAGIQEDINNILGDESLSDMIEVYKDNEGIRNDLRKQMTRKSNALSMLTQLRSEYAIEDVQSARENIMSSIYGVDYSKGGRGLINLWRQLNQAKVTKEGLKSDKDIYDSVKGVFKTEDDTIVNPERWEKQDDFAKKTEQLRAKKAQEAAKTYKEADDQYKDLLKYVNDVGVNKIIEKDQNESKEQLRSILGEPIDVSSIDTFFKEKVNALIGYVEQKNANLKTLEKMMQQRGTSFEQSEAAFNMYKSEFQQYQEAQKYLDNPYELTKIINRKTGINGSENTPVKRINDIYNEHIQAAETNLAIAKEDVDTLRKFGFSDKDLVAKGIKSPEKPTPQKVQVSPYDNEIAALRALSRQGAMREEDESRLTELIEKRKNFFASTGVPVPALPLEQNQYLPNKGFHDTEEPNTLNLSREQVEEVANEAKRKAEHEKRVQESTAAEQPRHDASIQYWDKWKEQQLAYISTEEQIKDLSLNNLIGKADVRELDRLKRIQQARSVRENLIEAKDASGEYMLSETKRNELRNLVSDEAIEEYINSQDKTNGYKDLLTVQRAQQFLTSMGFTNQLPVIPAAPSQQPIKTPEYRPDFIANIPESTLPYDTHYNAEAMEWRDQYRRKIREGQEQQTREAEQAQQQEAQQAQTQEQLRQDREQQRDEREVIDTRQKSVKEEKKDYVKYIRGKTESPYVVDRDVLAAKREEINSRLEGYENERQSLLAEEFNTKDVNARISESKAQIADLDKQISQQEEFAKTDKMRDQLDTLNQQIQTTEQEALSAARKEYKKMSREQKNEVGGYDTFTAARAKEASSKLVVDRDALQAQITEREKTYGAELHDNARLRELRKERENEASRLSAMEQEKNILENTELSEETAIKLGRISSSEAKERNTENRALEDLKASAREKINASDLRKSEKENILAGIRNISDIDGALNVIQQGTPIGRALAQAASENTFFSNIVTNKAKQQGVAPQQIQQEVQQAAQTPIQPPVQPSTTTTQPTILALPAAGETVVTAEEERAKKESEARAKQAEENAKEAEARAARRQAKIAAVRQEEAEQATRSSVEFRPQTPQVTPSIQEPITQPETSLGIRTDRLGMMAQSKTLEQRLTASKLYQELNQLPAGMKNDPYVAKMISDYEMMNGIGERAGETDSYWKSKESENEAQMRAAQEEQFRHNQVASELALRQNAHRLRQQQSRYMPRSGILARGISQAMEYNYAAKLERDQLAEKFRHEEARLNQDQTYTSLKAQYEALSPNEKKGQQGQDIQTQIQNMRAPLEQYRAQMEQAKQATTGFAGVMGTLGAAVSPALNGIEALFKRFGRQMFYKAINEAKRFVQEFDKQMTSIQMITLKSDSQMSSLGDGLISKAKDMKVSITELGKVYETLYRQGLSDEEVEERAESITKFSKVSGTDTKAATKLVTIAMNTGLASSVEEVTDIVTALGDNAATNAAEITKGFEKAGAAAAADGTTLAELASMLTAITATTQIGGNVAGRTLNTIMGRMNKIGTNELIYDENGNAVSGSAVAKLLKKQGIDMYDENGNKKSTYDVLYALSQKWEGMTDSQQQQIATQIAGTRQYSNFAAIMTGMSEGKVDEYMQLTKNSEGIVDEKNEIRMNSLQAAIDNVRNAWDEMINSLVDSGAITEAADALSAIITNLGVVLSTLIQIKSIFPAILGFIGAIKGVQVGASAGGWIGALIGLVAGGATGALTGVALQNTKAAEKQKTTEEKFQETLKRTKENYLDTTKTRERITELKDKGSKRTGEEEKEYKQLLSNLVVSLGDKLDLSDLSANAQNASGSVKAVSSSLNTLSNISIKSGKSLDEYADIILQAGNKIQNQSKFEAIWDSVHNSISATSEAAEKNYNRIYYKNGTFLNNFDPNYSPIKKINGATVYHDDKNANIFNRFKILERDENGVYSFAEEYNADKHYSTMLDEKGNYSFAKKIADLRLSGGDKGRAGYILLQGILNEIEAGNKEFDISSLLNSKELEYISPDFDLWSALQSDKPGNLKTYENVAIYRAYKKYLQIISENQGLADSPDAVYEKAMTEALTQKVTEATKDYLPEEYKDNLGIMMASAFNQYKNSDFYKPGDFSEDTIRKIMNTYIFGSDTATGTDYETVLKNLQNLLIENTVSKNAAIAGGIDYYIKNGKVISGEAGSKQISDLQNKQYRNLAVEAYHHNRDVLNANKDKIEQETQKLLNNKNITNPDSYTLAFYRKEAIKSLIDVSKNLIGGTERTIDELVDMLQSGALVLNEVSKGTKQRNERLQQGIDSYKLVKNKFVEYDTYSDTKGWLETNQAAVDADYIAQTLMSGQFTDLNDFMYYANKTPALLQAMQTFNANGEVSHVLHQANYDSSIAAYTNLSGNELDELLRIALNNGLAYGKSELSASEKGQIASRAATKLSNGAAASQELIDIAKDSYINQAVSEVSSFGLSEEQYEAAKQYSKKAATDASDTLYNGALTLEENSALQDVLGTRIFNKYNKANIKREDLPSEVNEYITRKTRAAAMGLTDLTDADKALGIQEVQRAINTGKFSEYDQDVAQAYLENVSGADKYLTSALALEQYNAENGTTFTLEQLKGAQKGTAKYAAFQETIAKIYGSEEAAIQTQKEWDAMLQSSSIKLANKYGDATETVATNIQNLAKGGKAASQVLGQMRQQMAQINNAAVAIKNSKGKSGSGIKEEERNDLAAVTGESADLIKEMSKEEIEALRQRAQESIDEDFVQTIGGTIAERLEALSGTVDFDMKVAAHVGSDGVLDLSEIEALAQELEDDTLATLAAHAGTIGELLVEIEKHGLGETAVARVIKGSASGTGKRQGKSGGGGGGKSKVDELLEKQKHKTTEVEHEIKMLQIEEKELDYNNDYSGQIDNINKQIDALSRMKQVYADNIKEMQEQLKTLKEGSDDWYKLRDAIYAAEEAYASITSQYNEENQKRISALEKKQENEQEPGKHTQTMLEKLASRAMTEDRFADYTRLTQDKIDEMNAQRSLNEAQIAEWEKELLEFKENDQGWNDIVKKIREKEAENAELENQSIQQALELGQQRLAQIGNVLEFNNAAATHNQNIASTYSSMYETGGYRDAYEEMIKEQKASNETMLANTRTALASAQAQMDSLEEGTPLWEQARLKVYEYSEAIARLTVDQNSLNKAMSESKVAKIEEDYSDATREVKHVNELLDARAQEYLEDNDYEGYNEATSMYLENVDTELAAEKKALNGYNTILKYTELKNKLKNSNDVHEIYGISRDIAFIEKENPDITALDPAAQRALEEKRNEKESAIAQLERTQRQKAKEQDKTNLDRLFEEQERAASDYQHNLSLVQYQQTKYQNAEEWTNYGRGIEVDTELRKERVAALDDEIEALKEQQEYYKNNYGPGTNEEERIVDQIKKREEARESENVQIEKNTKLLEENRKKIMQIQKTIEDSVDKEIEAEKKRQREILSANVSMQNTILDLVKKAYQERWEMQKKDIEREKESLNEYKKLITERFNYRKKASQQADKDEEIADYRRQLALIEADPTRTKDAKELRRKIEELEKDKSWNLAEDELNNETDRIDENIAGMDRFIQFEEEKLNDLLSNANNFAEELGEVLSGSFEESYQKILDYMNAANESFMKSLPDAQKQMIQGWEDTWKQANDIVDVNYDKITEVLKDKDSYVNYMKETNRDYRALAEELDKLNPESDAEEIKRLQNAMGLSELQWGEAYDKYVASTIDNAIYNTDEHPIEEVTSKIDELKDNIYSVNILGIEGTGLSATGFDRSDVQWQDKSNGERYTLNTYEGVSKPEEPQNDNPPADANAGSGSGSGGGGYNNNKYDYGVIDEKGYYSYVGTITAASQKDAEAIARQKVAAKYPNAKLNVAVKEKLKTSQKNSITSSNTEQSQTMLNNSQQQNTPQTTAPEEDKGPEKYQIHVEMWYTDPKTGNRIPFGQEGYGNTRTEAEEDAKDNAKYQAGLIPKQDQGLMAPEEYNIKYEFSDFKENPAYEEKIPGNKNGGLVDYTGLAWVDGTKTRPESFLDATDTAVLRSMLDAFNYVKTSPYMSYVDPSQYGNNFNVGDVNITINQAEINSDQDINALAKRVGEAFTRELRINGVSTAGYSFA